MASVKCTPNIHTTADCDSKDRLTYFTVVLVVYGLTRRRCFSGDCILFDIIHVGRLKTFRRKLKQNETRRPNGNAAAKTRQYALEITDIKLIFALDSRRKRFARRVGFKFNRPRRPLLRGIVKVLCSFSRFHSNPGSKRKIFTDRRCIYTHIS